MSINNLEGYNKRELIETIQIAQEEYQKLHKEHEALKLRAEKAEREIQGLEEKLTNFGLYVDDLRFLLSHHGDKIHRYSFSHGWLKIRDCLNGIDNEHAEKCGRAQLKEGE